jgi:DNA-binding LytR/AlgR family response regulator
VLQGREIRLITVDEIRCFRADHKYVAVVTAAESYISTPLKDPLQRLDAACFWQVYRGTIVNLNAVCCLNKDGDGRLSLHLKQRPETFRWAAPSRRALGQR